MRGFLLVRSLGASYGLPIESVVEVVDDVSPAPVPSRNQAVRGVVVVKGETLTVAHLGALLTGQAVPTGEQGATVVLLRSDGRTIALEVDDAEAVVREPMIDTRGSRSGWQVGVAQRAAGTVSIVDPAAVHRLMSASGGGAK